jgi:hypothetical protein
MSPKLCLGDIIMIIKSCLGPLHHVDVQTFKLINFLILSLSMTTCSLHCNCYIEISVQLSLFLNVCVIISFLKILIRALAEMVLKSCIFELIFL